MLILKDKNRGLKSFEEEQRKICGNAILEILISFMH